jgi:hypothetical protein
MVGGGDGWWERGLWSVVVNIKGSCGWWRLIVDWGGFGWCGDRRGGCGVDDGW